MEVTFLCKELHCLPGPGGLLDQDPYMVKLLKAGLSALHEKEEREMKKAAK